MPAGWFVPADVSREVGVAGPVAGPVAVAAAGQAHLLQLERPEGLSQNPTSWSLIIAPVGVGG